MSLIDFFLDPLAYDFMSRALATAVISAIICALLSCWLVLIGWSLIGDAVSHAVVPGIVLAYIFDLPYTVGAVIFGILAVILIGVVRERGHVKEDAAIGIVFTSLFALGLVLISVTPSQTDLMHIIFGNLLGVSRSDLVQIMVLSLIVAAVLLIGRRTLVLYAFDPIHMHAIGINPRLASATLLGLLALTTVVGMQTVGVILVVAMLIIPGVTAHLLTDRFGVMLIIAPSVATLSALIGLYASYYADTSSGGMIVLAQSAMFILAYIFSPTKGVLTDVARRLRMRQQHAGVA